MKEFIAQYWLEVFFGVIVAGLGVLCKRFQKMYKSEKEHQESEREKAFFEKIEKAIEKEHIESHNADVKLQEELGDLKSSLRLITEGLLSVQGREFRRQCRKLLEKGYIISDEEYEQVITDHKAYKGLGGNHTGDKLYELVLEKYKNQVV